MNKESGQVTILAALMLIVFVSVAAFCMNAAYAFHQHTQMQAEVDSTTLYASGTGCDSSLLTLPTGLTVVSPPTAGPYSGNTKYCEGVYQKNIGSLFGKMLAFPAKISVHAVAIKGGSTEPHFSVLGLSTTGDSHSCSVDFSGSEVITVTGNIYSDSSGTACGSNNSTVIYQNGSQYYSPSSYLDPYKVSVPDTGTSPVSASGPATYCGYSVPSGATYYHPSTSSGIALLPQIKFAGGGSTQIVLLPYCSGGVEYPGIYVVNGNKFATNGGEVDVIGSTVVVADITNFNLSGGTYKQTTPNVTGWYLNGYGVYQYTPCTPSTSPYNLGGNGTIIKEDGLFDLSCVNLNFQGGATEEFDGSLVGYEVQFGANSGSVTFNPPSVDPPRGALLVQ